MKDLSVLSSPDNYNEAVLYVKNDTIPRSCFRNGPSPAVGLKYDLDVIDILSDTLSSELFMCSTWFCDSDCEEPML